MRWKRLIKCAGGHRCADVIVAGDEIPAGAHVYLEYTCDACGTHYAWNSSTGKRQVIESLAAPGGGGAVIHPGETKSFFVHMDNFDPARRN